MGALSSAKTFARSRRQPLDAVLFMEPAQDPLTRGLPTEVVPPTPQPQANAFMTLWTAARDGRLWIPAPATDLIAELRTLGHAMQPSGLPKFSAPPGRHDDLVFALAWAVAASEGLMPRGTADAVFPPRAETPSSRSVFAGGGGWEGSSAGYTVRQPHGGGIRESRSPGVPADGLQRVDWSRALW